MLVVRCLTLSCMNTGIGTLEQLCRVVGLSVPFLGLRPLLTIDRGYVKFKYAIWFGLGSGR